MEINERQRKQRENFKTNRMPANHPTQRILKTASKQSRKITQRIQNSPQYRFFTAKIKNKHKENSGKRIIKIPKTDYKGRNCKKPPFFLLKTPHSQKTDKQSKKYIPVRQIPPKIMRIKSKNPERLGNNRKHRNPPQIPLNISRIKHPHGHTITKYRKRQPPDPPEHRIFRKKSPPPHDPKAY